MARFHIAASVACVLITLLVTVQLIITWDPPGQAHINSQSKAATPATKKDGYLLGVGKADITGSVNFHSCSIVLQANYDCDTALSLRSI
jgi:hypothetical protein